MCIATLPWPVLLISDKIHNQFFPLTVLYLLPFSSDPIVRSHHLHGWVSWSCTAKNL